MLYIRPYETPHKPTVYFDLDGVLADWVAGVARAFGREASSLRQADMESRIHEALGVSKGRLWRTVDALGAQFWADLPPFPDGLRAWQEMRKLRARGLDLLVLTSPSMDPRSAGGKAQWVAQHLGHGTTDLVVTRQKWKSARPTALLVDDRKKVLDPWTAHGGQGILMPRFGSERAAAWDAALAWATRAVGEGLQPAL